MRLRSPIAQPRRPGCRYAHAHGQDPDQNAAQKMSEQIEAAAGQALPCSNTTQRRSSLHRQTEPSPSAPRHDCRSRYVDRVKDLWSVPEQIFHWSAVIAGLGTPARFSLRCAAGTLALDHWSWIRHAHNLIRNVISLALVFVTRITDCELRLQ